MYVPWHQMLKHKIDIENVIHTQSKPCSYNNVCILLICRVEFELMTSKHPPKLDYDGSHNIGVKQFGQHGASNHMYIQYRMIVSKIFPVMKNEMGFPLGDIQNI